MPAALPVRVHCLWGAPPLSTSNIPQHSPTYQRCMSLILCINETHIIKFVNKGNWMHNDIWTLQINLDIWIPKTARTEWLTQVTWLVVTEVRIESFGLVTEHRHDMRLLCAVSHMFAYWMFPVSVHVMYFSSLSVILCAMRIFEARASSSRQGSLCAKFCRSVHCRASMWRKTVYSITHSLNHPAYLMCWEQKLSLPKTLCQKKPVQLLPHSVQTM